MILALRTSISTAAQAMAKWIGFGARRASTFEDPDDYDRRGLRFLIAMVHHFTTRFVPILYIAGICSCTPTVPSQETSATLPTTIAGIDSLILREPQNPLHYALRGRLHEALDSMRLAVNDHKRAIMLDSTNTRWRIALGDLYYRHVDLPNAEAQFKQAMRLAPDSNEARLKLAELRMVQGEFVEAMQLTNEALRLDDQNARAYYLKGWIHRQAGDTALAISSYRTAVERDPNLYEAYVALGLIHADKRDPLAMQYYNAAIELRPQSVEAWYDKGMYAQESGQDSIALESYARIKSIDPKNATAWYNTGYVLLEHQDRIMEARDEFDQAIALLPTYSAAYYNRGLTYELSNVLDSAVLDYRRALALRPDFDLAAEGLSRLQAKGAKVRP